MAEPIEFQIIQDLQTALRNISISNGYFHDVASLAVKMDPDAKVEDLIGSSPARPFIVLEVNPETFEYHPAEQLRILMPFVVHFVDDTDPKLDVDLMKQFFRLCADVEKAISVDSSRGGLATDTRMDGRQKRDYEGQLVWALISCEVRVYRTFGEPNG